MLSENDTVKVAPDVLASEIDNEAVVLGITSGKYYGFDETATEIWSIIQRPIRIRELILRLSKIYEGNRKEMKTETLAFLNELFERNLIVIIDEAQ